MRNAATLALGSAVVACTVAASAAADWRLYQNPTYRYQIEYPEDLFAGPGEPTDTGGINLVSIDGAAKLMIFAGPNRPGATTTNLAAGLGQLGEVSQVTYRRVTPHWFVLSGYLTSTGNIFYERIEVNASATYLSGFRIEYPQTHRSWFDGLLGHMGNSLTAPRL